MGREGSVGITETRHRILPFPPSVHPLQALASWFLGAGQGGPTQSQGQTWNKTEPHFLFSYPIHTEEGRALFSESRIHIYTPVLR